MPSTNSSNSSFYAEGGEINSLPQAEEVKE